MMNFPFLHRFLFSRELMIVFLFHLLSVLYSYYEFNPSYVNPLSVCPNIKWSITFIFLRKSFLEHSDLLQSSLADFYVYYTAIILLSLFITNLEIFIFFRRGEGLISCSPCFPLSWFASLFLVEHISSTFLRKCT